MSSKAKYLLQEEAIKRAAQIHPGVEYKQLFFLKSKKGYSGYSEVKFELKNNVNLISQFFNF